MEDPMTPPPPSPEPSPHAKDAQEALQKQVWEVAIDKFRQALREQPGVIEYHLGLGQAYEGKSRDPDGKPFLRLAMEEYRKAIRIDETCQPAHDALLAATTKAGLLEDVFEEYKFKLSKDPQSPLYKSHIKKIETLLIMKADSRGPGANTPSKWIFLERLLVIGGLICLVASVIFLTIFRTSPWALRGGTALIKSGVFLLVLYLSFKAFRRN